MTLSVKISQFTKMDGKRVLEEDNTASESIRKLRRCRVDVVRDYPKFCGLFDAQNEDGSSGAAVTASSNYVDSDDYEDIKVEVEEHHSPITSMKPNSHPTCKNAEIDFGRVLMNESKSVSFGDDSCGDDCMVIDEKSSTIMNVKRLNNKPVSSGSSSKQDQLKMSKVREFEWVEVSNSTVKVDDDEISCLSPKEWQNLIHTHKNRVELSNNLGKGKRHQAEVDESIDLSIVPYDPARDNGSRNKVQEVLNQYHELCSKLSLEDEEELNEGSSKRQVHIKSAMILKKANKWLNREQMVGHVPGVEIGDRFKFRAELVVVGLHHEFISGISYAKVGDMVYAFSVVDSGRYGNEAKSSDVLIYSGQGGNPKVGRHSEDQKLERGNLALKNSMDAKFPVRVIRRVEIEGKKKIYVYDGLYTVMKFSRDRDEAGKVVFMFEMFRVKSQPDCDHFNIRKQRMPFERMESRVVVSEDISEGKEKVPIRVVNELGDEKPAPFTYITEMCGMHLQEHSIPRGCECIGGCSDSYQCSCVRKNGGEIRLNEHGCATESKRTIYECGPNCKCPPSCQNRSSQHGLKLPLELFKTKTKGWGVRSRKDIPVGTFVCEYLGEVIGDMEAEKRANDVYMFDLAGGNDFTIDAANYGNVSRFINHACSPNLSAENVFYDHWYKKLPHVMLFASTDIPALTELTYDYNYRINSVSDPNGNIKVKECFCHTHGCKKRLY